jgi:type II secretory pathway predicted ATPase ExeA
MSLDEHGLVDLSKLKKRDYSRLFLLYNPFPSMAVPSEAPLITADRKPVLRRFTDVLSALYTDRTSSATVLLGDYGSGKSHLLKLFRVSVNDKLLFSDKSVLAVYVKSPGRSIRDLLLYLIDDVGRDLLSKLAKKYIFNYIRSKRMESKYLIKGKLLNLNDANDIEEYFRNTTSLDLLGDVESSLGNVKNQDLVRAFLALPHPEIGSYAWRWLIGSSLSKTERELLNIDSTIDDSHISEQVIIAFLRLLYSIGINGVVLLVDEFETMTLIPGISKGVYQDAIRHLIDSNPSGLVLFFAITPAEWGRLTQTPSALERRLAGSVIDLPPFLRSDVQELVELYLSTARSSNFNASGKTRTFPFNNESLEKIFSATKGVPQKVVRLCRLCIESIATCKEDCVNAAFVEKVIKEEGFR